MSRLWLLAVLALAALARPVGAEPVGEALPLASREVALVPDDLSAEQLGALQFRGGIAISSSDKRFGGLSGLALSPDGGRLYAVSDEGHWVTAALHYSADSRLIGIGDGRIARLVDGDGRPLQGKDWRDAEAVTPLGQGWLVAFEHHHRLWFYPALDAYAVALTSPPGLSQAPANGGMEAVTTLAGNRLLALTEELPAGAGALRGWVGRLGDRARVDWSALSWARTGDFKPTAATELPGGGLLVLERRFSPLRGIGARLSVVADRDIEPGARLVGRVLAELDGQHTVDNFEGVAARRGAAGETLIYILSDDNFSALQRTLLLMFAYPG